MLRIIVDRDLCESNAVCVNEAPEVFGLDEASGLALHEESPSPERLADVRRAVARCPRGALSLVHAEE
jgi:ferredoxin